MKTKIAIIFSMLIICALAVAAVAYNRSSQAIAAKGCCKAEACPMRSHDTSAKGEHSAEKKHSCCDMPECCCNGGACPMMNKGANGSTEAHSIKTDAEHKASSLMECCKGADSCPMHSEKDGHGAAAEHEPGKTGSVHHADSEAEHKGCCACCSTSKTAKAAI